VDQIVQKIVCWKPSFQTTENDITDAFAHCGAVEAVSIITDRDTGRSKGFGFVTMSEEDAAKAIAQLNGSQLDGRALTVKRSETYGEKRLQRRWPEWWRRRRTQQILRFNRLIRTTTRY